MIRVPSADVLPDGDFEIYNNGPIRESYPVRAGTLSGPGVNIGFLPRFEIGAMMIDPNHLEDLAVDLKAQAITEHGLVPNITVGTFDLRSNTYKTGLYVVAGKHFWRDRVNATVGFQRANQSGPFGGLELAVLPHLSGIAEYDSRDFNYGVKAGFLKNQIIVSGQHIRQGWALAFGTRLPLGKSERNPAAVPLPLPAAGLGEQAAVSAVRQALVHLGLENVSAIITTATPRCLEVTYENRAFPHTEMDALANVLAAAAVYAPDGVTCIGARVLRDNIPIIRVTCPLAEYRDFIAGKIDAQQFAPHVDATYAALSRPTATTSTGLAASSHGHADLILRPALQTALGTEDWQGAAALLIRPELYVPITNGLDFDALATFPVGGPIGVHSNLPKTSSGGVQLPAPILDRVSLDYSWRPNAAIVTRTFAGSFDSQRQGGYTEAYFLPGDHHWMVRGALGILAYTYGPQQPTATLDARYYQPTLNLTGRAVVGQFLDGDKGEGIDITRRFGETDLGVQLRDTTIGKTGAVTIRLPIGPSYLDERPSLLRVVPPDFMDQGERSLLTRPNYTYIANRTGNELTVGTPAIISLLGDNRLNPLYFMRSLPELRRIRVHDITRAPLTAPGAGPAPSGTTPEVPLSPAR